LIYHRLLFHYLFNSKILIKQARIYPAVDQNEIPMFSFRHHLKLFMHLLFTLTSMWHTQHGTSRLDWCLGLIFWTLRLREHVN